MAAPEAVAKLMLTLGPRALGALEGLFRQRAALEIDATVLHEEVTDREREPCV